MQSKPKDEDYRLKQHRSVVAFLLSFGTTALFFATWTLTILAAACASAENHNISTVGAVIWSVACAARLHRICRQNAKLSGAEERKADANPQT